MGSSPATSENEPFSQTNCARSGVSSETDAGVRRDGLVEALRGREVGDANPQVVDRGRLAHLRGVDRFDAVAVGVEQEAAGAVEGVDELAGRRVEAHVQPPCDLTVVCGRVEREVAPLDVALGAQALLADDWQDRVVEAFRRFSVRRANVNVIDQARAIFADSSFLHRMRPLATSRRGRGGRAPRG